MRSFRAVLVLLGAILFAHDVRAGETVAVDMANPPFMYGDFTDARGVYPALLREAFKRMGVDLVIEAHPWKRALAGLDQGANGVGGIYKTAERLSRYDFSDELFSERILVYAAVPMEFTGVPSLYGKRVGVLRGWSYGDEFDDAVRAGRIEVEEVGGDAVNFDKLARGRIDVVLAIDESALATMKAAGIERRVVELSPPLKVSPTFLAFNKAKGKAELLARFNATMAAIRSDGTYDKIVSSVVGVRGGERPD